ncbi:glutathione transferase GST 23-like [Lycium ferocissimum]|uniref:glutathione transferase GST 23-like n=1 Tax=Lycium ferocissimum TaxID=112874 RepID=UPI0028166217|nr:glutathione transferase GST 23-like [Lycium ferocissimum]
MEEQVKLLGTSRSPFSYRVVWALKHKGINYEYIEEDLFNKSHDLLTYNPIYKMIPVLVHAGKPVVESTVILEYIEETWPQNPLFPKDPHDKAEARFWIKFGEDKSPDFFQIFHTIGEEQAKATENAKEVLKIIEQQGLGEKKFFGGNTIGLTDIAFGWIAFWLEVIQEAAGVKVFQPDDFPCLQSWINNFKQFPVIKENIPDRDALLDHFKRRREMVVASKSAAQY